MPAPTWPSWKAPGSISLPASGFAIFLPGAARTPSAWAEFGVDVVYAAGCRMPLIAPQPPAGYQVPMSIVRLDQRSRRNILLSAFATDRQPTAKPPYRTGMQRHRLQTAAAGH